METRTTRFGNLDIKASDVITFPAGMVGLGDCRRWVLLADSQNDSFGWMQSIDRAEIALAVVSPRRYVTDYEVRIPRGELRPLELDSLEDAHVLVILSKHENSITLNLKAPLVINLQRCLGRQVINNADQPIQYQLVSEPKKRIA